jgi:hypothetical protein
MGAGFARLQAAAAVLVLPGRKAVESSPGKVSGAWVFKGTHVPVVTVIENLQDLMVDVTRDQMTGVLDCVAESLRGEGVPCRCSSSLTTGLRRG